MKRNLILGGFTLLAISAMPADLPSSGKYVSFSDLPISVSANGRYVVGNTFYYDVFKDRYDEFAEPGFNLGVNNDGNVAGYIKDTTLPMVGGYYEADEGQDYRRKAAIWIDGEKIELGYGDSEDPETEFGNYYMNGTYAFSISNDNKIIYGLKHSRASDYADNVVCWVYNDATGTYDYKEMDGGVMAPHHFTMGLKASADGSTMAAEAKLEGGVSARGWLIYTDLGRGIYFCPDGHANCHILDINSTGDYILFYSTKGGQEFINIYDVYEEKVIWSLSSPAEYNFSGFGSIGKDLRGFVNLDISTGYMNRNTDLYFFDGENDTFISASNYLRKFAESVVGAPANFYLHNPSDSDASGRVIIGHKANVDGEATGGWLLVLPAGDPVVVNPPTDVEVAFGSPTDLIALWNAPSRIPDETDLLGFHVTIDNVTDRYTVDDLQKAPDGRFMLSKEVTGTTHSVRIAAIVTADAGEFISEEATATGNITDDTHLLFFDDFENVDDLGSGNIAYIGNDWFPQPTRNDDVMLWHLEYNLSYANQTPLFMTQSISDAPWQSCLDSRWFDATDASNFYFTFQTMKSALASGGVAHEVDSDTFQVQYTTDGVSWTTLWETNSKEYAKGRWFTHVVELDQLAGKSFRLRFRAAGEGKGYVRWLVDNTGIMMHEEVPAVTNLRALKTSDTVALEWGNTTGGHEFSYLYNNPQLTGNGQCVGSQGLPLIVAIDLPADDLAPYVGEEITHVTTLIYDNPEKQADQTTTEAIVYKDGEEVSRQLFGPWTYNEYDWHNEVVMLDNPVLIEAGHDYRVGIRISNYASNASPLWYQSHESYIPGVTDLFSEDEGETWEAYTDYFADLDEETFNKSYRVIWPIRVTFNTPGAQKSAWDQSLYNYDVYRNGVRINKAPVYFTYPRFVDENPLRGENAAYTVRAYYSDGRVSPLSEPLYVSLTAVEDLANDLESLAIHVDGDNVAIDGAYLGYRLYDLQGHCLVSRSTASAAGLSLSGLSSGVYLLNVDLGGTTKTLKLLKP